jgi:chemotaxis response regulator CheB
MPPTPVLVSTTYWSRVLEAEGLALAQDEATSVVCGMSRKAGSLRIVGRVLPVDRMAGALVAARHGGKR